MLLKLLHKIEMLPNSFYKANKYYTDAQTKDTHTHTKKKKTMDQFP
jgi:hypothetical protein